MRRIIVTGCRDWTDADAVRGAIAAQVVGWSDEVRIVHGACPTGADALADAFCAEADIPVDRHPADWSQGKAAGPRRNAFMARLGADLCLAFWDGKSKGTEHMIRCAVECGIPVRIVARKR